MADSATRISELERLAKAATPGQRVVRGSCAIIEIAQGHSVECYAGTRDNAAFIAACDPQTILALLAEREKLLEVVKAANRYKVARQEPRSGASATEERVDAWFALRTALEAVGQMEGKEE